MSDYGIRISADGVDVKTGADKDMVITSKYSMLKGSLSGSGTISIPFSGVKQTVTIAHGLGYIPMAQAFWNDRDGDLGDPNAWYPLPFYFVTYYEQAMTVRADATNVYLEFSIDDFGGGSPNLDVKYAYYIFIDKGKL